MAKDKYKYVHIVGKGIEVPFKEEHEKLYKQNDYKLIHKEGVDADKLDLDSLKGSIDSSTIINVFVHGIAKNGVHELGDDANTKITTKEFLSKLASYHNGPMNVCLDSCFGGAAAKDVSVLPKGSKVVIRAEEDRPTLIANNPTLALSQDPTSKDFLEDTLNRILLNASHTCTIAISRGKDIPPFKFTFRSSKITEHPEVLTNPDNIVKIYEQLRLDFVKEYNETFPDQQIDPAKLIPLKREDAEEWARSHFNYLACNGDTKLTEALNAATEEQKKNGGPHKFADLMNKQNLLGEAPLFTVTYNIGDGEILAKKEKLLDALINAGADLNIRTKKDLFTPLMYSILQRHENMAIKLIRAGADVNLTDVDGSTALIHATSCFQDLVCDYLLSKGADETIKNKNGKTARDFEGRFRIKLPEASKRAIFFHPKVDEVGQVSMSTKKGPENYVKKGPLKTDFFIPYLPPN